MRLCDKLNKCIDNYIYFVVKPVIAFLVSTVMCVVEQSWDSHTSSLNYKSYINIPVVGGGLVINDHSN